MKRIVYALFLFSTFLLALNACKHPAGDIQPTTPPPTNPGNGTGSNGTNPADTALCFERDVLPIFQANCSIKGCHSGEDANSRQEGFVFNSYQTITSKEFVPGNPGKTELYEAITEDDRDKRMPYGKAPLTDLEISRIYRWIAMGAPNTTGCSTGCDSSKFTFSAAVQPMLNFYCKGCHNSSSASSGVILDNYVGVRTVASDGRLLNVIKHISGFPAMPQGGNKLSDCQISQIEKWVAAGALND